MLSFSTSFLHPSTFREEPIKLFFVKKNKNLPMVSETFTMQLICIGLQHRLFYHSTRIIKKNKRAETRFVIADTPQISR